MVFLFDRHFWSDFWGLSLRQTGGAHEGGEDHPAASADEGYHWAIPCRAVEDMDMRRPREKTQKVLARKVRHFASFFGRSAHTATPEDLRAYQHRMTQDGVSASTFSVRTFGPTPRRGRKHCRHGRIIATTENPSIAAGQVGNAWWLYDC